MIAMKNKRVRNSSFAQQTKEKSPDKKRVKLNEKIMNAEISDRLKKLRIQFNYEQTDVVKFIGFPSRTTYSALEQKVIGCSVPRLKRLKELYNTTYEYLIEGKTPTAEDFTLSDQSGQLINKLKKEVEKKNKEIESLKEKNALLEKYISINK